MKFQLLLLTCYVLSIYGKFSPIPIEPCAEEYDDESICEVDEVDVDECNLDGEYCELRRGTYYRMDVKFTPKFEGSDLTLLAYAMINGRAVAFQGMNSNACDHMACPVQKDVQQNYVFNVTVDVMKPKGHFDVFWLMKQNDENRCCFANKFKIL